MAIQMLEVGISEALVAEAARVTTGPIGAAGYVALIARQRL
jgi:hypothetical protein